MPQPTPLPKERVLIAEVNRPLASMHERPTFTQAFGAQMLHILLWVICGKFQLKKSLHHTSLHRGIC